MNCYPIIVKMWWAHRLIPNQVVWLGLEKPTIACDPRDPLTAPPPSPFLNISATSAYFHIILCHISYIYWPSIWSFCRVCSGWLAVNEIRKQVFGVTPSESHLDHQFSPHLPGFAELKAAVSIFDLVAPTGVSYFTTLRKWGEGSIGGWEYSCCNTFLLSIYECVAS